MWCLFLLLSCSAAIASREHLDRVRTPVWPNAYEVSYVFELPYVKSTQPEGLKYPVHVIYDGASSSIRIDAYEDLDINYITSDATYNIYPRIDTKVCEYIDTKVGPTLLKDEDGLPPPLPSLEGWDFGGVAIVPNDGQEAYRWQLTQRHFDKVNTYTFYTSKETEKPLALIMVGVNLLSGSHYDQYIVSFKHFAALKKSQASNAFVPPKMCNPEDPEARLVQPSADIAHARRSQALSLLPSAIVAPASAEAASPSLLQSIMARVQHRIAAPSADPSSSPQDSQRVKADLEMIEAWNNGHGLLGGPRRTYHMAPNKFLGMPEEQWRATAKGLRRGLAKKQSKGNLGEYKRVLADHQLPKSVDWRGTGADGPVKDQATCGSCWAFATAGAMTSAWFLATGQSVSLSEQQLVDCSWDYEENGCGGGWMESALEYIASNGGAAGEWDYPYMGQNDYCKAEKASKAAFFKGYMSIRSGDEKAMMEAVALHGPMAISFDASQPGFKYYSGGVFFSSECGHDLDSLDHAVILVGYGTTADGTDYWLLRNTWSVLWGEGGYFKMARKGNDCGVSLDGVMAVVDEDAALSAAKKAPGGIASSRSKVAAARAVAMGSSTHSCSSSSTSS